VRSHPANAHYQHQVADIAYSLASLAYHERKKPDEARPLLQKALDIEEELNLSFPAVSEYGFYLGNLLRDFRGWFGDTAPLEAWRDRLMVAISEHEHEARLAPEKRDRDRLGRYYLRRAIVDRLLGRYSEFVDDMHHSVALGDFDNVPQATRALRLAQQGQYAQAASEATALATSVPDHGAYLYAAAQLSASLVRIIGNDRSLAVATKKELSERLGKRAVEWIQKAKTLNYLSAPSTRWLLTDDRELDPLRERANFRALLATGNRATQNAK
jgi:tetratricopeptide (TPR) repeat protein